jgi:antitoxin ParD1/3/4
MSDLYKVWPESDDTAKARIEQAQKLKSTVADAGLRFDVYLPPDLASWILEQVERGDFIDPAEAVFIHMQQARDLDSHDDLKSELLKRKLLASMKSGSVPGKEAFERIFNEAENKMHIQPARWEKIKQPE